MPPKLEPSKSLEDVVKKNVVVASCVFVFETITKACEKTFALDSVPPQDCALKLTLFSFGILVVVVVFFGSWFEDPCKKDDSREKLCSHCAKIASNTFFTMLIVLGTTAKWVTKCYGFDVKVAVLVVSGLFVASSLIRACCYLNALRQE